MNVGHRAPNLKGIAPKWLKTDPDNAMAVASSYTWPYGGNSNSPLLNGTLRRMSQCPSKLKLFPKNRFKLQSAITLPLCTPYLSL